MKKKGKSHDAIVKVAIAAAKKGKKPPKKSMVDEDGDVVALERQAHWASFRARKSTSESATR